MFAKLTRLIPVLLVAAGGCDDNASNVEFDAGSDFSLAPQITHVGPGGLTCCMQTLGSSFAMYLANPVPGTVDANGHEHPTSGDLHIVNAYGVDFQLASKVPAYGYGFSPDGNWAIYQAKVKTNYSLSFARIERPEFNKPTPIEVVPDGIQDYKLVEQSFYSSSGKYLVIGVLAKNVMYSADLHVIDVRTARDVFNLPNGAFNYLELTAADDTMIFNNSTGSTKVGTPSTEGLYVGNLPQLIAHNAEPALIQKHVSTASLMDDGVTLLYLTATGDLFLYDLVTKYFTLVGTKVVTYSPGPGRRGPIVWVGGDGSLHVVPKLGPETVALPPASAAQGTAITFSPEGARLYWFKKLSQEDAQGELYTMQLPPNPSVPVLIGTRVSSRDFSFINDRLVYVRNVDPYGLTGDVVSANPDGTDPLPLATGMPLGNLQAAFPSLDHPTPVKGNNFGPRDLSPEITPPVLAGLTEASQLLDSTTKLPLKSLNGSAPLFGKLAFGRNLDEPMGVLNTSVHDGTFRFSDDGNVLAYVGDATWDDGYANFVGKLELIPARRDIGVIPPTLEGVTEIGPVRRRAMFINAPANGTPGIYYLKF